MIVMVAARGAAPADARDSSYEHQQYDGSHCGDPGAAGLSEFYNDDRRPGLKARFSNLEAEIVRERATMTAAWLRLRFYDYMVDERSLYWRDHHNNEQILQDFDYHAKKMRRVNIKSGSECNTCRVWHSFNT